MQITLSTYTHWFAKRGDSGLGAKLEAMLEKESAPIGPELAPTRDREDFIVGMSMKSLVARAGIELARRGFSVAGAVAPEARKSKIRQSLPSGLWRGGARPNPARILDCGLDI